MDQEYVGTKLVSRLESIGFTPEQIDAITAVLDVTCKHCWDADETCQCWNDE